MGKEVVCATTSSRRQQAVLHALDGCPVIFVDGGEEDSNHPCAVAEQKVAYAKRSFPDADGDLSIFACDTQSQLPVPDEQGIYCWRHHGKPNTFLDVGLSFGDISQCARYHKPSAYFLTAATCLYEYGVTRLFEKRTMIELDPDVVTYLATTDGLETYLRTFVDLYASPPYRDHGHAVTPKDICAGLSFPVLTTLGAVSGVDGAPLSEKVFRDTLYLAAVGIDPNAMAQIVPEAAERLESWPWISDVTEYCLRQ